MDVRNGRGLDRPQGNVDTRFPPDPYARNLQPGGGYWTDAQLRGWPYEDLIRAINTVPPIANTKDLARWRELQGGPDDKYGFTDRTSTSKRDRGITSGTPTMTGSQILPNITAIAAGEHGENNGDPPPIPFTDEQIDTMTREQVEAAVDAGLATEAQLQTWITNHPDDVEGAGETVATNVFGEQDAQDVFDRFLQTAIPGFGGLSGIARGYMRKQGDPIFREHQIMEPGAYRAGMEAEGGEHPFFDFLKQGARPTVDAMKESLGRIYDIVRGGEVGLTDPQEAFGGGALALFDPESASSKQAALANQMAAGMAPFLRNVPSYFKENVQRGIQALFRREKALDPTMTFFDYAKKRGWLTGPMG